MSPLWTERLEIALTPRRIALARHQRVTDRILTSQTFTCHDGSEGPNWQGALETLKQALHERPWQRAGAQIVLSNHFIRYSVLPRPRAVRAPGEVGAYVKHRLAATYGEVAHTWAVRTSRNGNDSILVAAVDQALIDQLRDALRAAEVRITSIQPFLMAAFNRVRNRFGREALWYVLVEPGKSCIAALRDGTWLEIETRRGDETLATLPSLLEQAALTNDDVIEIRRVVVDVPNLPQAKLPQRDGWQFIDARTLQRRRERTPFSTMKLALAGGL